jgi:hypothetical protein
MLDDWFRSDASLGTRLLRWGLGALGLLAIVRLVPRLVRSTARRFLVGVISEVVLVSLIGLVSQRMTQDRTPSDEPSASNGVPRR